MRKATLTNLACAITTLAMPPAHGQDRYEVVERCSKNVSHVEARDCLTQQEKISLKTLDSAQRHFMESLYSVDEDADFKQQAITAAESDTQEFIAYVDKHCESFAALAFGGNSKSDRRLACRIELNYKRAEELNKVAASLQD